ncbi:MAG: NAD(P)-dependent oxidoreductase [Alphaproteobacteria bacterium]|nr:NAD(P)-dependent oxidoreductase [Alphaproteobacteria bacterium]MDE2630116.1 NAD(P)-dependent oxidoreductase [Alphaproteobacteria bacterium]
MGMRPHTSNGTQLTRDQIEENFADLHPPLTPAQAGVEASRCLYCYDAPCVKACPTSIDIPGFIHRIRTGNLEGSARTILSANIMGGTCGRACPTEVLCEEACVLNARGEEPVRIGALQRYAVEHLIAKGGDHPFKRAAPSGKKLAVIGAGPAGLSFAHRAAMLGHAVTVFDKKPKAGGLNEYGLAAYKMANDFAQAEVKFLLGIGGIAIEYGKELGHGLALDDLKKRFDAVFVGAGLAATNALGVPGEELSGVRDALDFIEEIRQARDKSAVRVGKNVIVIGGGNTAIDAAVQSKRLGAESVTLVYRRGENDMSATGWERDLARTNDVVLRQWSVPVKFEGNGAVEIATFARARMKGGKLEAAAGTFSLAADMVLKAIGQKLDPGALENLRLEKNKVWVDADYRTSVAGVYAGGDCISSGEDLTVQAVEDGKRAAHAADAYVRSA